MADVVSKTDATVYALSVHTPDYPAGSWLINPAGLATLLSGSVPNKYWKHDGGVTDILEMTQGEKDAVDAAEPNAELVFSADDATPSVADCTRWCTANANATSVTTFDGGGDGQIIRVRITDAKTTFVDGATLDLIWGLDLNAQEGETWVFQLVDTVWCLQAIPQRAMVTHCFGGQVGAGDETEKALVYNGDFADAVVAASTTSAKAPLTFKPGILIHLTVTSYKASGGDTHDRMRVTLNAGATGVYDSSTGLGGVNGSNQRLRPLVAFDAPGDINLLVTKSGTAASMDFWGAITVWDNHLR